CARSGYSLFDYW
nr:immunoglobulin heavy chain junction region [Macaca mulatta]MOY23291.1 immunoglobulin heavy chain junction region [Macaca mulatta]MOY26305.1 immunoglobulin heavy chain junction region [Macaca mulatta]MOY28508.1 immunoglobulin heavy chain junction region [Macaca mulatta]MOY28556.1 immunoglobulin heavy chain junction region [Macaca mulatta]